MLTAAVVGADGAGKTTVARKVADVAPFPAVYLYMGENPQASAPFSAVGRLVWLLRRRRGVRPTGGPPPLERPAPATTLAGRARGKAEAAVQLALLISEEVARQRAARRHMRRGTVVVCDRDFFADYRAHDLAGDSRSAVQRAHGLILRRLYRRPDLTIVLDAPADVLFARKPEGDPDALEARRQEYLDLAGSEGRVAVIDVDRPLDDVVADVVATINDHPDLHPHGGVTFRAHPRRPAKRCRAGLEITFARSINPGRGSFHRRMS